MCSTWVVLVIHHTYNLGKYEVTARQYVEFLNAVAKTDAHGLYNANMWNSEYGCKILRSGSSRNYTYAVAPDYANRPVNHVCWGVQLDSSTGCTMRNRRGRRISRRPRLGPHTIARRSDRLRILQARMARSIRVEMYESGTRR